jgi:glycosyltransferase involved in cell wall biosynthesis
MGGTSVPKKMLMFVIPSLVGGGAEQVLVNLIGGLSKDKYEISIVLFENKGEFLPDVPYWVQIHDLRKTSRLSFFCMVFRLRALLKRLGPDTVECYMPYANLVTALAWRLAGGRARLVMSVHNHLTSELKRDRQVWLKRFLYRTTLNWADAIICVSRGIGSDLSANHGIKAEKIRVIYNPFDLDNIDRLKNEPLDIIGLAGYVVAVGRLTRQKGYPYLLEAYSLIHKEVKEGLVILGQGEDEEMLKELAHNLGIESRVSFVGFQTNPYKFLRNASLFVSSSLLEGFGNVIVEAMACGVPVICTDCPFGPAEIVTNGEDGILVAPSDEYTLSRAMLKVLKDDELRRKFAILGRRRAETFRKEEIIPQYEEMF